MTTVSMARCRICKIDSADQECDCFISRLIENECKFWELVKPEFNQRFHNGGTLDTKSELNRIKKGGSW